MPKFDKSGIEIKKCIAFDNKVFLSEGHLEHYVDSCDAEYETYNFYLDSDDVYEFVSRQEMIDVYVDEDALYEDERDFDARVDALMSKYDISHRRGYATGSGRRYTLYGTYGNLKKFADEYCGYIDWGNPGEHLSDCADTADIDFDSGDDKYILGIL